MLSMGFWGQTQKKDFDFLVEPPLFTLKIAVDGLALLPCASQLKATPLPHQTKKRGCHVGTRGWRIRNSSVWFTGALLDLQLCRGCITLQEGQRFAMRGQC
jgi:hypothetical protein